MTSENMNKTNTKSQSVLAEQTRCGWASRETMVVTLVFLNLDNLV